MPHQDGTTAVHVTNDNIWYGGGMVWYGMVVVVWYGMVPPYPPPERKAEEEYGSRRHLSTNSNGQKINNNLM